MGDDLIRLGVKGWWIVAKDKVVMEEDLEGIRGSKRSVLLRMNYVQYEY